MKKQTLLALLMATFAILMLATACGSSDNTDNTPPPATSQQTAPQQEATPTTVPETQEPEVTADPADGQNTPEAATPANQATPWPSPLPTRREPTAQPTATAEAQPAQEPGQTPDPTEAATPMPVRETLPEYDGLSPLIHVYVGQPFILFQGGPGNSTIIPLKGLTQEGDHVTITNPAQWGITFETTRPGIDVDQDGKYSVLSNATPPAIAGIVTITAPASHFEITLRHPNETLKEPQVSHQGTGGAPRCLADFGPGLSYLDFDLNWFYTTITDPESIPHIEQRATALGANPKGTFEWNYRTSQLIPWKPREETPEQLFFLAEYAPGPCPTIQETLNIMGQMAQTTGVKKVSTVSTRDEHIAKIRRETR